MRKKLFIAAPLAAAALVAGGIATAVAHGSHSGDGTPSTARSVGPAASITITNCKLPKTDFTTNDTTGLSTTSTTYVPVPGMTKSITQGTTTAGCVVVDVSAYSYAAGTNALEFVSVTLDGAPGNPGEVQFSGDDDEDGDGAWARTHAAVFAFTAVAPGAHTVSMVFRSFDGQSVALHRPAMTIEHK